jgi:lipopolysaccharide/colanic/teichoic acid biosynthesis glycosyltransferase
LVPDIVMSTSDADLDATTLPSLSDVASFAPSRIRTRRLIAATALAAGDLGSYLFAAILLSRWGPLSGTEMPALEACAAVLTIIFYQAASLYPGDVLQGHEILRRRVVAALQVGAVATASTAALIGGILALNVAAFLFAALLLQPVIRAVTRGALSRAGCWGEYPDLEPATVPRPSGGLGRGFDLAVAATGLICATPLLLLAGATIWLVDPGPVIYRQARVGLDGRTIRIFKLRTMYRDADERLQQLLATSPEARDEWQTHFKLRHDPRVLPHVGHFLRSTSCDELPQMVNILIGDMRLVGPRPFPHYHLSAMPPEFQRLRSTVVPGLTGLWQVTDRGNADIELQQKLDGFYIQNRSLWLDLHILMLTVGAVFGRRGAF